MNILEKIIELEKQAKELGYSSIGDMMSRPEMQELYSMVKEDIKKRNSKID